MASSFDYIHPIQSSSAQFSQEDLLLFLLHVVGEVPDRQGRASSLLGHVPVLVVLADAQPFSEGLSGLHLKHRHLVLRGQPLHNFYVVGLGAVLGKDHVFGLHLFVLALEGLCDLVDALRQQRVGVGGLDDALEGGLEINGLDFCGHRKRIKIIFIKKYMNIRQKVTRDQQQLSFFLGGGAGMKMLSLVPWDFMQRYDSFRRDQQAYLVFVPAFALTAQNLQPQCYYSRFMIFLAQGDGQGFRSHLLPRRIFGTEGSSTSFTCSIQYSSPLRELSSASEKTMKMPSEPLKKFLATDLYLSCPEVSHNSTLTFSPSICLTSFLQSAPIVLGLFSLKHPSMILSKMLVLPTELSPIKQVLIFLPIYYKSILNLFAMRHKTRFYQLAPMEKEGERMQDIYRMMSRQDQNMAQLLSKYQEKGDSERYQQESRTIEVISREEMGLVGKRGRSASKLKAVLELPIITPSHRQGKKQSLRKSKEKKLNENLYSVDLKSDRGKSGLKIHLKRAYGTSKLKSSRSKSTIQTPQSQLIPKFASERVTAQRQKTKQQSIRPTRAADIPLPLGYLRPDVQGDSSSEQGEVPLSYYQKQYRQAMRSQCLQQTNFLYFSKNESMKDWTQGLLLLFQKHDKQLQSLRRRCKYLQRFDYRFFTIDIFRDA